MPAGVRNTHTYLYSELDQQDHEELLSSSVGSWINLQERGSVSIHIKMLHVRATVRLLWQPQNKARIRSWSSALIVGVRKVYFSLSSPAETVSHVKIWTHLEFNLSLRAPGLRIVPLDGHGTHQGLGSSTPPWDRLGRNQTRLMNSFKS